MSVFILVANHPTSNPIEHCMCEERQAEVTPMVYLYWVLARRSRRSGKAWVEIIADVGLRRILVYGNSMAELHDEHVPQSESFFRAVKISICQ